MTTKTASIVRLFALAMMTLAALAGCEVTPLYIGFLQVDGTSSSSSSTSATGGAGGTGGVGGGPLCMPGAMQPCYDGPAGTENKGICTAGTQTCAADGSSWGPCVGEVLPQPENCATPIDEDCDGKAPPCKGALLWAKRFGGSGAEHGQAIASDGANNVLVTGYFYGAVDFGGGLLGSAGQSDAFVVKLSADGSHVWSRQFGGSGSEVGTGVAVDGAGNVIVTGRLGGTVDFGGGPLTSGQNGLYIVKLDANGSHVWSKGFGDIVIGNSVAVDGAGNVVVAGHFHGTVDFGGGLLTSGGDQDIFVAKFDATGAHVWSRRAGDSAGQYATSVAVDDVGNVIVTGRFSGTIDFGGAPFAGGDDIFVVKLDSAGNHVWSKGFGDANTQNGNGVAVDPNGNVIIAGEFSGTADFGGGPLVSAGGTDIFVSKLDASGGHLWSERFGDANDQTAAGVATDPGGNVLVTGGIAGEADFGGGPLASAGAADLFVVKLDASGGYLWGKRVGDATDQLGQSIAADVMGNVLVTGTMYGSADFGAGPLASAGSADIFVAKLGP